jgi:hypothetical protein
LEYQDDDRDRDRSEQRGAELNAWRWGLADDIVVSLLPHVRRALT